MTEGYRSSGDFLTITLQDSVALIQVNAPERRNALTADDALTLRNAVRRCSADHTVSCLVLGATGPVFSAGAHRSVLASLRDDTAAGTVSEFYSTFNTLYDCSIPTIAAVEGPAVGAGFNLVLCCDVIVASRGARFESRFLKLGIHPGGGHAWLLRRALGYPQAAAMILANEILEGERAYQLGFVTRLVEDGAALSVALAMARDVAQSRRELLERAKTTVGMPESNAYATALSTEEQAQLWSLQHEAVRTALRGIRDA